LAVADNIRGRGFNDVLVGVAQAGRDPAAGIGRDGHKVVEGGRGRQGDDVRVNRVRTAQTVAQRSVVT
jgi:hypothetical protein